MSQEFPPDNDIGTLFAYLSGASPEVRAYIRNQAVVLGHDTLLFEASDNDPTLDELTDAFNNAFLNGRAVPGDEQDPHTSVGSLAQRIRERRAQEPYTTVVTTMITGDALNTGYYTGAEQ